jgi:queuosine precursor transporter
MITQIIKDKPTKLFVGIAAFFVANAIIANCIGGKIISFEKFIGIDAFNFSLFGQSGLALNLTCGVLLWPLEFIITDIVNEYYGPKAVRRISITAVVLIIYAFTMFYVAMQMPAADFWFGSKKEDGVADMSVAFNAVFGQGMWIILGSVTAFFVSQIVDVTVFHKIKKATGDKKLWLRATGSTFISQFVDSFLVLFIAFYIGNNWSFQLVLAICIVNYIYKICVAILLTPVVYLLEKFMDKYLGKQTAAEMKLAAMAE